MGVGLGAGALFIPIIEEPTVFIPLWTFCALALAAASVPVPAPARASILAQPSQPGPPTQPNRVTG